MSKILIADAAGEFRVNLVNCLLPEHVVYDAADGNQALALAQKHRPDLIIMDVGLPMLDGITLLEQLYDEGCRAAVLVMGAHFSEYSVDALIKLQVGYILSKPCCVESVARRAEDILHHHTLERGKLRSRAADLLSPFGIPTHLKGYKYLLEGFCLMVKKPSQYITKELYPAIAHKYMATGSQVERCIRNAVDQGIDNGDKNVWILHFGSDSQGAPNRPANNALLALLLELNKTTLD